MTMSRMMISLLFIVFCVVIIAADRTKYLK